MSTKGIKRITHTCFFVLVLSVLCLKAYALPFSIIPNSNNPIKIVKGTTITATYTVTNNTNTQRNNNYIKYLPLNTKIQNSGCGNTFNLAPLGVPGDSCTLTLTITGPVNGGDRNPHHHLFICYPGGETCNGSSTPLNIPQIILEALAVTPIAPQVPKGLMQQFTATALYSDNSTANVSSDVLWVTSNPAVASINSEGEAKALSLGTTNITASQFNIISKPAVMTVTPALLVRIDVSPSSLNLFTGNTHQFTATGFYTDDSSRDLTDSVSWKSSDTNSATITNMGLVKGITPTTQTRITAILAPIKGNVVSVAVLGNAYLADASNVEIQVCPINLDKSFGNCTPFISGVVFGPTSIALTPNNKFLYIANTTVNFASFCTVNTDGSLGTCGFTGNNITNAQGVAINPTSTLAYFSNGNNTVTVCTINTNGTLSSCNITGSGTPFVQPLQISINPVNTFAYVPNFSGPTVSYCAINATTGDLSSCAEIATSADGTVNAITINDANTKGYILTGSGTIFACPIKTDGTFSFCPVASQSFFMNPTNFALAPTTDVAYVIDNDSSSNKDTIYYCPINAGGLFDTCVTALATTNATIYTGIALTPKSS